MNTQPIPPEVLNIMNQLASLNRALNLHAKTYCGRHLTQSEERNLNAALDSRQQMIHALNQLGFPVECGSNVWRPAPRLDLPDVLRALFDQG